MSSQIKIISGWSNPGGSTDSFIRLTNLLNENGHDCTFYGPHNWHLDKCKSATLVGVGYTNSTDIIISHFISLKDLKHRKHILSCHETDLFKLSEKDLSQYDLIHYVSNNQLHWQKVNHPYVVIPNIVDKITWTNPKNNIAGVIGSINNHKRTHVAIERALADGFSCVYLFCNDTDDAYYDDYIGKFAKEGKISFRGFVQDKEQMYNLVEKVFHASKFETFGLVEAECLNAGIPFEYVDRPIECSIPTILTDEEILKKWERILI